MPGFRRRHHRVLLLHLSLRPSGRRPGSVPAARWRPSPPTQVLPMCHFPPLPFPAACFCILPSDAQSLRHMTVAKHEPSADLRLQLSPSFVRRSHQPSTYLSPDRAAASLSPSSPDSQATNASTRAKGKIPKGKEPCQPFKRGQLPKLGGHGRVDGE